MRINVGIVPAFGLAALVISDGCGCLRVQLVVGPIEGRLVIQHWCRDREALVSAAPRDPATIAIGMMEAMGVRTTPDMRDFSRGLAEIFLLPRGERGPALEILLDRLLPPPEPEGGPAGPK